MEMFQAHSTYFCRLYHVFIAFFVLIQVTKGTIFNQGRSRERYYPKYSFYHNLSKLNECIHNFAVNYPEIVEVEMRYRSRWGLSQYLIHVSDSHSRWRSSMARAKVLLSFGEHSNEFFPVESMLNLLENITMGFRYPAETSGRNFTMFILNHIDLYIMAIVNPDGRSIIEQTGNYCWRHTSNQVDLNVDNRTRSDKENTNKLDRIVTEPECKFLSELLPEKFDAFVSFHSGQRGISIPNRGLTDICWERKLSCYDVQLVFSKGSIWEQQCYVTSFATMSSIDKVLQSMLLIDKHSFVLEHKFPVNIVSGGTDGNDVAPLEIKELAQQLSAIVSPGTPLSLVSLTDKVDYSIFSHVSLTKKVPFTYVISLWGNGKQAEDGTGCFDVYNPESEKLMESLQEVYPVYETLFHYVYKWKETELSKQDLHKKVEKSGRGMPYTTILAFVVFFSILVYILGKYKIPLSLKIFYRRQRRIVSLRTLASTFI